MIPKDKKSICFGVDLRASHFKKFVCRSSSVPALKPVVARNLNFDDEILVQVN